MIDRGPKIDKRMYEANLNLQRKVRDLEYDKLILNNKMQNIKDLCEMVEKVYPDCKSFASRIIFIIEKDNNA